MSILEIKCPKCGGILRILSIRKLDANKVRITLVCSRCDTYFELDVKTENLMPEFKQAIKEEVEDLVEKRITLSNLSPDAPMPIRIVVSNSDQMYIPIFYTKIMAKKPKMGEELSDEYLASLGIPSPIRLKLLEYWLRKGIKRLYTFQEKAIKLGCAGKNTVIVAPTGTGKTEAFTIPAFIRAIEFKKRGHKPPIVLIVYPTKALARDQLQKLYDYGEIFGLSVRVLDGDTPHKERREILARPPDVLITNFDMIHYHLGKRSPLGYLFPRARIIIIDELHEYFGAFGTHVHYILKRLRRLAMRHGSIQFFMASATIRNPREFAYMLTNEDVITVEETGRKEPLHILFVYSPNQIQLTVARILTQMIREKIKTLAFFNTRKSAELALHILRKIAKKYTDIFNKFDLHRAGLPKKIRHAIENAFKQGKKLALMSTPTLELGIDIGDVDLVISEITPIDRFIQRSGRTGRRERPGSAILVLRGDDPISEYYARNPEDYFGDISSRYIEPNNVYIAEKHVYLMAYEEPIEETEIRIHRIPPEILERLQKAGAIFKMGKRYYANGTAFPKYFTTNIRGSDKVIRVLYNGKTIDEREVIIAIRELHPGAIYINRGVKYLVKKLDIKSLLAEVMKAPYEYEDLYTRPIYTYSALPLDKMIVRDVLGTKVYYGKLLMKASVEGYVVFKEGSRKPLAEYDLEHPIIYEYETYGIVFRAPPVHYSETELIAGAYHALEHIVIEGTNVITGGGSEDLGGISFGTTGVIVIYEATPGGNGVSRLLFERFESAIEKAFKILNSCKCKGDITCNKCVYSYRCGNNNQPLFQLGALQILKRMLNREPVPDADKALDILRIISKGIV